MNTDDMPVCLVTGSTGGIGRAIAEGMVHAGFHVVVTGRNPARVTATTDDLTRAAGPNQVSGLVADLSMQAQVHNLARQMIDHHNRLDVLVNNAGVSCAARHHTADGIELTWAVNHLAPFLLTHLLLDRLTATAPARVVNVTSAVQAFGRLDLDDVQFSRRRYAQMAAYAQSKLAMLMASVEFAHRLAGTGVTVNSVHPGGARTDLGRDLSPPARLWSPLVWLLSTSSQRAAAGPLHLATTPGLRTATGGYFVRRPPRPGRANRLTTDAHQRQQLWYLSRQMTGLN